ncbi:MAG: histidine kinase dimerization/phospho-acceptor domain-containing protein [Patescibacteria group bacterium]
MGALSFGVLIFHKNWKDTINRVFFLLMASVALWSLGYWYWLSNTSNAENALLWVRILSLGSLFIPVFYFHWILLVLNKKSKKVLISAYISVVIFTLFSFSPLFVKNVQQKFSFPFWPNPGILYSLYLVTIYLGLVIYSLWLLFNTFKKEPEKRGQVFYVILGSILGFGGGLFNFFLWYNIPIKPYGNFLVVSFSLCFGYAMLRYGLFHAKTIATELLTFTIWILLLIRVLQSQDVTSLVVDSGILAFSIIAGIFLVKSVSKEVAQREKLEILTKQLESANVELKRLDAAKSEFVSIVSHQLRTPLTAVKGYISMIKEGTYGKITAIQQDVLEKVFQSGERLIAFINDLLNLNRIEDGRITYAFAAVDLAQMVDEVVFDLKAIAELKKLKLTWIKPHGLPMACNLNIKYLSPSFAC